MILGGELLMVSTDCAWRASAAYLYVLGLDGASLAWEYLRGKGFNPENPRDASWGERYFHMADPDGHELSFARPI